MGALIVLGYIGLYVFLIISVASRIVGAWDYHNPQSYNDLHGERVFAAIMLSLFLPLGLAVWAQSGSKKFGTPPRSVRMEEKRRKEAQDRDRKNREQDARIAELERSAGIR